MDGVDESVDQGADEGADEGADGTEDEQQRGHRTTADRVVVLLVYVVPLGAVSVLLALAGLGVLAVGLLAVEGAVVAATVAARRRPARPSGGAPSRRPWLVPLVMVAVLGAIVALAVLGSRAG